MSTVLHPAGPEPAQTYWMRRLAVIGVAVVVLAVAGALIVNGTSSGSAVQGESPPPLAAPATAASTPTRTPSATARPSVGPSSSTLRSTRPSRTASDAASRTAAPSATAKPAPRPQPTVTPTLTAEPKPVVCDPGALRPTLTGAQRQRPKQRSTFTLSLINGSGGTCTARVNRDNFELTITSGSDRIWTTRHCATIVKSLSRTLAAEQAVEWKVTWNGRRSRNGCQSRPETPRPGTYYATAQLAGAEPVRLLMRLAG